MLTNRTKSSWGLATENSIGIPRTDILTFTVAESTAMITSVKSRVGPQYTISHLGHAAMVLALLRIRPLPSDTNDAIYLCSPLPVNGRRYLKDPGLKRYGCCQAGAVASFSNLRSWIVDENDREAVKKTLKSGCRHVKESYDYWLNKEYQIAVNVSKDNFLASYLSRYV
jgi:hypothetical protein